jgi:hypothetical protein
MIVHHQENSETPALGVDELLLISEVVAANSCLGGSRFKHVAKVRQFVGNAIYTSAGTSEPDYDRFRNAYCMSHNKARIVLLASLFKNPSVHHVCQVHR